MVETVVVSDKAEARIVPYSGLGRDYEKGWVAEGEKEADVEGVRKGEQENNR